MKNSRNLLSGVTSGGWFAVWSSRHSANPVLSLKSAKTALGKL
jgi:hypothetical protein